MRRDAQTVMHDSYLVRQLEVPLDLNKNRSSHKKTLIPTQKAVKKGNGGWIGRIALGFAGRDRKDDMERGGR